jgi:hypothetical protein
LADNIVALGLFGRLMRDGQIDKDITRRETETVGGWPQRHRDGNLALGTGLRQQAVELLVVVTIEAKTWTQTVGHTLREQTISLYPIHTETLELTITIQEAETVAVGEGRSAGYRE